MKNYLLLTALFVCCFLAGKSQNSPISLEPFPPKAKITNNLLNVEWTSFTENNVKQYNIEVSKNGTTFTKIGSVSSKAEEGNSTSPLSYTFTKSTTGLLTSVALLLPLLGFSVYKTGRNKTVYRFVIMLAAAAVLIGCHKSDTDTINKTEILYLRIAQVDNTGNSSYSFVVKVQ